jgi:hypothetical protein
MTDTCEGGVLAADEYAGVQHDGHEKASLTVGETEGSDGSNALCRRSIELRFVRGRDEIVEAIEGLLCTP